MDIMFTSQKFAKIANDQKSLVRSTEIGRPDSLGAVLDRVARCGQPRRSAFVLPSPVPVI